MAKKIFIRAETRIEEHTQKGLHTRFKEIYFRFANDSKLLNDDENQSN